MSKRTQRPAHRTSSRSLSSQREQGRQAFTKGDLDGAITYWTKALLSEPSESLERALAEAYFRRACIQHKRPPDAVLADLQAARALVPDDSRFSYYTGLTYHQLGKTEEALTAYRESLRHESYRYDRPAYHLCLLLAETGQDPSLDPAWELLTAQQQDWLHPANSALDKVKDQLGKGDLRSAEGTLQRITEAGLSQYYLGVIAWRRGQPDKALDCWLKAQSEGFKNPALQRNLVAAYVARVVAQANSPEVTATVRAALRLAPNLPVLKTLEQRAEFLAGNRDATAGNWQSALGHWQKVRQHHLRQNARVPRELIANIANAYEHVGRWSDSAETWREFIRRRPRRGENAWPVQYIVQLWRHIDTLYARAGHFVKSAETLRYAIKAQPDDLTLSLALVKRYMESQNWQNAKSTVLRILETVPNQPDALALYAEIIDTEGDLDQMIEAWERVSSTSGNPLAKQRLGKLYIERGQFYQSIEDDEAATVDYEKALLLSPGDSNLRAAYGALLAKSARDRAQAEFEKVDLSIDEAALAIVKGWYRLKNREEAERWLKRATQTNGKRPSLFLELGAAIFDEYPEQASKYLDQALAQAHEREQPAFLTWIAVVHAAHKRSTSAYDYARRALKQDARFGPAHVHLGLWDAAQGRRSAALTHFQKALQWAEHKRHSDIVNGIEEAIGLLEEGHNPTLDDILDTIDPEQNDHAMRRMMGRLQEP